MVFIYGWMGIGVLFWCAEFNGKYIVYSGTWCLMFSLLHYYTNNALNYKLSSLSFTVTFFCLMLLIDWLIYCPFSSAPELVSLLSELNNALAQLDKKVNPLLSKVLFFDCSIISFNGYVNMMLCRLRIWNTGTWDVNLCILNLLTRKSFYHIEFLISCLSVHILHYCFYIMSLSDVSILLTWSNYYNHAIYTWSGFSLHWCLCIQHDNFFCALMPLSSLSYTLAPNPLAKAHWRARRRMRGSNCTSKAHTAVTKPGR